MVALYLVHLANYMKPPRTAAFGSINVNYQFSKNLYKTSADGCFLVYVLLIIKLI